MKKINLISLGCSKNLIDTERLMSQLSRNHFQLQFEPENLNDQADAVIINTCGFIHDAKEESIGVIFEQIAAKNEGRVGKVYVMGCLSERYRDELTLEIPELDGVFGVNDIPSIVASLQGVFDAERFYDRKLTTAAHFAYMKISEGCDRNCSFCAIPSIRGKHVSVPLEKLVSEAQYLASQGVKELLLIAQDLSYYGYDLYKKSRLADLLKALTAVPGIEWIRLHYAYPHKFPIEVIDLMASEPKICKYLDIPFQHIHNTVLKNMRRNVTSEQTYDLIREIRNRVPDIALRTTLMVGHPGETEEAFEALKDFVREVRFDRLGVFTYSEEEGTYGALAFEDSIPEDVKTARADEIMSLQQEIAFQKNTNLEGRILKVIIDRKEGDYYIARSEFDSPEVDNELLVSASKELSIGSFQWVQVTSAEAFDAYADWLREA